MSTGDGQTIGVYRAAWGPRTRNRLVRLPLIYAGLYGAGLLLIHNAAMPGWRAFGLGLMLPGGGFLAYASGESVQSVLHIALAICGILGFALGLFAWFASGNVLVAPAVWLIAAVAALVMNHPAGNGPADGLDVFVIVPLGIAGVVLAAGPITVVIGVLGNRAGRRNDQYVTAHRSSTSQRCGSSLRWPDRPS